MKTAKILLSILISIAVMTGAISEKMTYQGKLTDASGIGITDVLDITFNIYDVGTGGLALWTEAHTGVAIEKGLFSVVLGGTTPITLDFDGNYYLEIVIDGDAMTPRVEMTAEGYAFRAKYADEITGGLTLDDVLVIGNSTEDFAIVDDSDDIVEIDDALEISNGHRLMVDAITPEGTDVTIDFGGNIDLNGNYINNSDASSYDGRVAFNDNIVPVNPAQDIGVAAHRWDDIFLSGNSRINIDGDEGAVGEVLSITPLGMEWQPGGSGSAGQWVDGGIYKNVIGNDKLRAYELDQDIAFSYTGERYGSVDTAGIFKTDWDAVVSEKIGISVIADAYQSSDAYGVKAIGRNYGGGLTGGNKYGVYGTAEWGAENYGIYGTNTGTSGNQYAIYGDQADGEYAGFFDGNVSITGSLEDSDGDPGVAGQILSSTLSGTNWVNAPSGMFPGGTDGMIQYNDGGSFGGADLLHWDDVNSYLGIGAEPMAALDVAHDFIGLRGTDLTYDEVLFADYAGLILNVDHAVGHADHVNFVATGEEDGNHGSTMEFWTRNYSSVPESRMIITEPGDVGIGTTSPSAKFHVVGNGEFDGNIDVSGTYSDSDGDVGTAGQILSSTASGTNWIDFNHDHWGENWTGDGDYGLQLSNTTVGTTSDIEIAADTNGINIIQYVDDMATPRGGACIEAYEGLSVDNYYSLSRLSWLSAHETVAGDPTNIAVYAEIPSSGAGGHAIHAVNTRTGDNRAAYLDGSVEITGALFDGTSSEGTTGQILSSTGSSTEWIDAPSGSGADADWTIGTGLIYNEDDEVAIGTNTSEDHGLNVLHYSSGEASVRGIEANSSSIYSEGMLGVLGYSGIPGGIYNIGVLGIKNANGATGSAMFAWNQDDNSSNYGLYAYASGSGTNNYAIYARAENASSNFAGFFQGEVHVNGSLSKSAGSFLIDHPLDPENKTLRHNFVESPENLCVYRGEVKLDASGEARIELPEYFEALVDEDGATVHPTPVGRPFMVGYEWDQGRTSFVLYGDANRSISYIVYADRDDPVMNMLRKPVEEEKGNGNFEKGTYLTPEAFGQPVEKGFNYAPPIDGDSDVDPNEE